MPHLSSHRVFLALSSPKVVIWVEQKMCFIQCFSVRSESSSLPTITPVVTQTRENLAKPLKFIYGIKSYNLFILTESYEKAKLYLSICFINHYGFKHVNIYCAYISEQSL